MKRMFLLTIGIILFVCSPSWAQERGSNSVDDQLAVIATGNITEATTVLENLLHSKVAMTRSRALEESVKSKERRIREIGYRYLLNDVKSFIIELSIPREIHSELERHYMHELTRVTTIMCKVTRIDDNNNFFLETGVEWGNFTGNIAGGSINIVVPNRNRYAFKLSGYAPGFIIGTFELPKYSFAAKIALP